VIATAIVDALEGLKIQPPPPLPDAQQYKQQLLAEGK